jgi:hypothetical protein
MPKIGKLKQAAPESQDPEKLRPYLLHGLDLVYKGGDKDALGDCILCGREGRFSIRIETGQWQCLKCGEKGNIYSWLSELLRLSIEATADSEYEDLAKDRALLFPETIKAWELGKSILTDKWLIPGYNKDRKLSNLYQYTFLDGRMALMPTPTLGHQMFGLNLFDKSKPTIYLCEGFWDSIALWEVLGRSKMIDGVLTPTSSPTTNMLIKANVVGMPASFVFKDAWVDLFDSKRVNLMPHNDHNRKHPKTGALIPSASYSGMSKVSTKLANAKSPASDLAVLHWGGEAAPTDKLKSGYDVRDKLGVPTGSATEALASRVTSANELVGLLGPVPQTWLISDSKTNGENFAEIPCAPCKDYRTLVTSWRKAMKWTDGLDLALSVMLASVASTMSVGEQLWVKILGPPSCGKTTLVEGIAVASRYVVSKSTIRGFHSGFKVEGGEDTSLISKLKGKTLAIKDGDTLLKSPNLSQILSEARDIYDRVSRTHYRNAKNDDYSGVRMTWILCGTSALREIDESELGARFIDCVVMEGIDDEFEDEVGMRVAFQEDRNMSMESDENASSQNDPALTAAMSLTGGYVEHLRARATELYNGVTSSEEALRKCAKLGKFVAIMRARPGKKNHEDSGREFAARLIKQQVRMAKSLAIVLNRTELDDVVMDRVTRVAMDTSRGITLHVCEVLSKAPKGLMLSGLAMLCNRTENDMKLMLRFLRKIGVVTLIEADVPNSRTKQKRWYLTDKVKKLYFEVKGLQHHA